MTNRSKLAIKDITLIAVCSVILLAAQLVMRYLPNIELVSLIILLFTQNFGKKTLYIIYLFVFVQGIIYGFGLWWITYLYVWAILYFLCALFKDIENSLALAIILAIYGLLFGVLCSPVYFISLGPGGALSWIISGFPFDLMHCIGNFITTIILYKPLQKVFKKIAYT